MKITYDEEAKAIYIYLKEFKKFVVDKIISLSENINIDLINNELMGVEFLDMNKVCFQKI